MNRLGFAGLLGFLVMVYGLILAFVFGSIYWYNFFVVGAVFFLGYTNYRLGTKSFLYLLQKEKRRLIKTYFVYFLFGVFIEIIGRIVLNLWYYPTYSLSYYVINVLMLGYPPPLFFVYELFVFVKHKIKSFYFSLFISTLLSAFVSEFPNTFAWVWVYTIPFVKFEILKINIVVIVGWVILVLIPILVNNITLTYKKKKLILKTSFNAKNSTSL